MTLKEYLVKNLDDLKGKYENIKVADVENLQGVIIMLNKDSKLDVILNDKPVIKYLGYNVIRDINAYPDLELKIREGEALNSVFYFFECLGVIYDDYLTGLPTNYTPVATYKSDKEAIKDAANYEATLYKVTYKNGERIKSKVLYEPCF